MNSFVTDNSAYWNSVCTYQEVAVTREYFVVCSSGVAELEERSQSSFGRRRPDLGGSSRDQLKFPSTGFI